MILLHDGTPLFEASKKMMTPALLALAVTAFVPRPVPALALSIHSHISAHGPALVVAPTDSAGTVITIMPGDARLRPDRVVARADTIALLVTPRDSAEGLRATLIRTVARVTLGGEQLLRETQHYQFSNGNSSDDTLDVRASTLAPVRYFSRDHATAFDVHIDGTEITGWRADSSGARHSVQARASTPFFVSITSEAFAAAFPFDSGATLRLPMANPPSPDVRNVDFRAGGTATLNSAHGRVSCRIVTGPGQTTNWIARSDGHLIRLHWTLPNGTTIWKLPASDVALR